MNHEKGEAAVKDDLNAQQTVFLDPLSFEYPAQEWGSTKTAA